MSASRPLRLTVYREERYAGCECGPDGAGGYKECAEITVTEWRWNLKAGNGRTIDASTEGYTSRAGVEANLLQTHGIDVRGIAPGEVVDVKRVIVTHRFDGHAPRAITQVVLVEVLA